MAEDEKPKFRYQDVPDLGETFADTVGNWTFDGNTLRIEFLVSRTDPEKPSGAPTGRAVPVRRLGVIDVPEHLSSISPVRTTMRPVGGQDASASDRGSRALNSIARPQVLNSAVAHAFPAASCRSGHGSSAW